MHPLEFLLEALQSLAAASALALSAWGFGQLALRLLRWPAADSLTHFVWSQTLGLVLGGFAILGLALAGCLQEMTVAALTLAGLLCAAAEGACTLAGANWRASRLPADPESMSALLEPPRIGRPSLAVAVALAGLALGIGVCAALAPPAAPRVLMLALAAPKSLLLNGGYLPGFLHGLEGPSASSGGLNLSQMWSVWALALDGPVAANLLHAYLAVLLAAATVVLARPLLGRADAWFAGGLALLVPGVQHQLGVPFEAIPQALVATLAVTGLPHDVWEFGAGRSLAARGVMLGAAAAISPAGLLFSLALLAVVWQANQRPRGEAGAGTRLLPLALVAALVAVPWLWLGGRPLAVPLHTGQLLATLGPVVTIALGGLAFARRLHGLKRLLLVLGVYLPLAIGVPLGPAAWAPLVPLCCVAATWGWCEVQRLPVTLRTSVALLMLLLATCDVLAIANVRAPELWFASGRRPRAAYLADHVGSYRAAVVLDRISLPGQRLLSQSPETLYFACPTTLVEPAAGGVGLEHSPEASGRLIARACREGYAYLLLAEPVTGGQPIACTPLASADELCSGHASGEILESNGEVIPILEYCSADDNNRPIRYRLLKLQGPQAGLGRVPPVASAPGSSSDGLPRLPTR